MTAESQNRVVVLPSFTSSPQHKQTGICGASSAGLIEMAYSLKITSQKGRFQPI